MPHFRYRAIGRGGEAELGEVASPSRTQALDALMRRGLSVTELTDAAQAREKLNWRWLRFLKDLRARDGLTARELLALTQSLAALFRAGLTLDRALVIAGGLMEREPARRIVERIASEVRAGSSFSQALGRLQTGLPPYYASFVQAGEAGGTLAESLARLGEMLRRDFDLRERVRAALVYPALLAAIVLMTLVVLLTFVLPRFRQLFAESEAQLPLSTRMVLGIGGFLHDYWWAVLTLVLVLTGATVAAARSAWGRDRIDEWILRGRWTLGLPLKINCARLLRTMGTLLQNGVILSTAVRVSRGTVSNARLRNALDQIVTRVNAGQSLSSSMVTARVFPAHAVQLARVGEETGGLDALLIEAAVILEGEAQLSLERLITLLVPMLTIGMGVIIAGLIGSVLIGLLSINELAF
jgi:general secretion pathway protein F